MFIRTIQKKMDQYLNTHQSFTIYGARRTGKTTLIKNYAKSTGLKYKYVDCDLFSNQQKLSVQEIEPLIDFIGDAQILLIDEAQRVKNIGLNMKIIHDHIPTVKVIATGSSALDLASEIKESMTGRDYEFNMYPLSLTELNQIYDSVDLKNKVNDFLIYGTYPEVIDKNSYEEKIDYLYQLTNNYLYKDILELDLIKKPSSLLNLLRILATSLGSEVTATNLADKIGLSKNTVEKYLDLLEKCFIITIIKPYNKKIANEIKYPFKVYFWDCGVRNALVEDFRPIELRSDYEIGGIWENFIFIEKIKQAKNSGRHCKYWFWRTSNPGSYEYDLIEEENTELKVYEIKYGLSGVNKVKKYPIFFDTYKGSQLFTIFKENFTEFLVDKKKD
jgi:uncharacterized protein